MIELTKLPTRRQDDLVVQFRCDSSSSIGGGHVYRDLALAELLVQNGFRTEFLIRKTPGHLARQIRAAGHRVRFLGADLSGAEDAKRTVALAKRIRPLFLVADGYSFTYEWTKQVAPHVPLVVVDDLAQGKFACQLLINPNYLAGDKYRYKFDAHYETVRALGAKYSILRQEFRRPSGGRSRRGIAVFFGAYDEAGETLRFLNAVMANSSGLTWKVIVSRSNKHLKRIRALKLSRHVELYIQPEMVSDVLRSSEIFFGSGGTITSERVACGLPAVVVSVAKNQEAIAESLAHAGCQIYLGRATRVDYREAIRVCARLTESARLRRAQLRACEKIFDRLKSDQLLAVTQSLALRPAEVSDARFLYELRRDPTVAAVSINKSNFTFRSHLEWLRRRLAGPAGLFIVRLGNEECGQVRVDGDGTVSLALAQRFRGRGLAPRILKLATGLKRRRYVAYVQKDNRASLRAFRRAGFRIESRPILNGEAYVRLIRPKV